MTRLGKLLSVLVRGEGGGSWIIHALKINVWNLDTDQEINKKKFY